jgi:hypothetical protein
MYGRAWSTDEEPGRAHDADVDRLWVVHTSSGMYLHGGMPGCEIGQKAVLERACKWDAYSPPRAWGTVRLVYPLGWT